VAQHGSAGAESPAHYGQVFIGHCVITLSIMALPCFTGQMSIVPPLQIGARDVSFTILNALSFWMLVADMLLINISLGVGEFAKTGWVAYPPLSGLQYSHGVGVDYYLWALQLSGLGTTLTGVNFLETVLMMRTHGMTRMDIPT
ncbi:cytochrome o ubiquinol oxidase subunit I, partial [Pseudomonas syringae]